MENDHLPPIRPIGHDGLTVALGRGYKPYRVRTKEGVFHFMSAQPGGIAVHELPFTLFTPDQFEVIDWCQHDGSPPKDMRGVEAQELERLLKIESAVLEIVSERADNLCWRDVYEKLAGLVGVTFCPDLIEPPECMLANCCQFVRSLREGGPYKPVYVERASEL